MSQHMFTTLAFTTLVAALATSTSMAGTESSGYSNLEMQVYSDASGGAAILSGAFDAAIRKGSANADRNGDVGLVANTNLCVAYTKAGRLDRAEGACNRAVVLAEAERSAMAFDLYSRGAGNRARAIALSNRGVLRTVQGDKEGASGDFRDAVRLGVATAAPRRNLSYLETAAAARVAMTRKGPAQQ